MLRGRKLEGPGGGPEVTGSAKSCSHRECWGCVYRAGSCRAEVEDEPVWSQWQETSPCGGEGQERDGQESGEEEQETATWRESFGGEVVLVVCWEREGRIHQREEFAGGPRALRVCRRAGECEVTVWIRMG